MDHYPRTFIVLGSLLGVMGLSVLIIGLLADGSVQGHSFSMLSLSVLAFCMSYLYPQFKQKDERMKSIRQKAVSYAFTSGIGYMLIFSLLAELNVLKMDVSSVLSLIIALSMTTLFLLLVFLARKY
ncbi:permease [Halobacillus kuroshimensis]|uniref:Permease n=1 Tax=Halobacillus kuroshimensis TaxID=302481 RepID=A0ABS3DVK9_9BACI|nr:permease [Halobacillus kuroshimensis]MBN8235361.1 permease [Halobacillus kuroshimensis]